jgi:hypothetical protein
MSFVRVHSPAAGAAAPSTAASAVPPIISRSIVAGEPAAPPVAQASALGAAAIAAPVLGPTATPVIQRIDGSAPTPPAPADEKSDRELDELARAIFGRLRTRLRSEYIFEREAKGLTFDNS